MSFYAFIIFIVKRRFPVTLNRIHLIDRIIDLIQQFCIALFNNDIEIAAAKFIHDSLIVWFFTSDRNQLWDADRPQWQQHDCGRQLQHLQRYACGAF